MLRNSRGQSPFVQRIVFTSEVAVFATPDVVDSKVTVKVGGDVAFVGIAQENSKVVSGLYVAPNEDIEVEIEGGGAVFLSILEENIKMIGGVSVAKIAHIADGTQTEFALPNPNAPAHNADEVLVFLDGMQIEAFALNDAHTHVVFDTAPYTGAELMFVLTKPQD